MEVIQGFAGVMAIVAGIIILIMIVGRITSIRRDKAEKPQITQNNLPFKVSGHGNKACFESLMSSWLIGGAGVGIFAFLTHQFGYSHTAWGIRTTSNDMNVVLVTFTILIGIVAFMEGIFKVSRITDTRLIVSKEKIEGKGVHEKFPWTFSSYSAPLEFDLLYNQITTVDVKGSSIVIRSMGTSYKCYVPHPNEIRYAILSQKASSSNLKCDIPSCPCGYTNPENMKFCGKCGNALN